MHLQASLWFIPILFVLAGAAIAGGTIALDSAFGYDALPHWLVGDPAAASAILSTIAMSMVSLTALVLTITMVVVQLAMGQFSPRIVQRILRDKPSQIAIGLFVATFVHAILTLRQVTDNGDGSGRVPGVALLAAFLLVLASITVLVVYVQHIGRALRVSALIELVGKDTRKVLDRVYPDKGPPLPREDDGGLILRARESGVVAAVGTDDLLEAASLADGRIELLPALGEFVPADAPLFRVTGHHPSRLDVERLYRAVVFKLERNLEQDVAYGIRMLVDIAERSLSESPFQDPTTAVQAIDRLHDILRQLVRRPFPSGRFEDADGVLRLVVPAMTWDDYVRLAFQEIRLAGAGSPQVTRKLKSALLDLRSIAPDDRKRPIDEHLELVTASAAASADRDRDAQVAETADAAGFGAVRR